MKRQSSGDGNEAKRLRNDPIHKSHSHITNVNYTGNEDNYRKNHESVQNVKFTSQHDTQRRFTKRDAGTSPSSLTVHPISHFNKEFPYFRKPSEIGSFSQDINRKFQDDSSQLKIYCPPENKDYVDFDLRLGYDSYDKRDESVKEKLDDLLRWIHHHKDKFAIQNQQEINSLSTDFVCWRGLLTKLLCTPYENREGWLIGVTLYNNTYYMCEFDTEEKIKQLNEESDRQKEMSFWGVKFEQYVTSDPEANKPNTQDVVNNKEAFCSVVRGRLSKHSMVYGGEIDCFEEVNGKRKYLELKTSREIENPRQMNNFKRFKALRWWAQSFLVGIEKIICGFRDDHGTVHRLEDFTTQAFPKYCQDIPNCWQPNICFNFLDSFLQFVKDSVKVDNPSVVHLFSWRPRQDVKCVACPPNSKYSFLPDWYNTKDN